MGAFGGAGAEAGTSGKLGRTRVADPYVIHVAGRYYMYYLGQDRARRQRLGVGVQRRRRPLTKLRSNPVLGLGAEGAFDENGLGEPAVWISQGRYWMLYTGRDRKEHRRLGLAWSLDGARWDKMRPDTVISGGQEWNSKVLCDPSVLVDGDVVRVWFVEAMWPPRPSACTVKSVTQSLRPRVLT